jgi:hypothetical protein
MPNRSSFDEHEKYDHSGHPTDRRRPEDLKSPGGPASPGPGPDAPRKLNGAGRKNSRIRRIDVRGS